MVSVERIGAKATHARNVGEVRASETASAPKLAPFSRDAAESVDFVRGSLRTDGRTASNTARPQEDTKHLILAFEAMCSGRATDVSAAEQRTTTATALAML